MFPLDSCEFFLTLFPIYLILNKPNVPLIDKILLDKQVNTRLNDR